MYKKLINMSLPVKFTIRHFFITLGTAVLCFIGMLLANRLGVAIYNSATLTQVLFFAIVSVLLGTVFSAYFIRKPLKPFDQLLNAMSRVSKGDYSVRLNARGPHMIKELNNCFNHMASELGSIEMLRSDFINNFSHEFKTPIVSISGFARVLKRDDLTPEERNEYLDIIIRESDRLAELSTNILNLSMIENQHILTDKREVNISEQIRLAVALLEKKWSEKKIDIQFDSEEVYLSGDEKMLKQVWINLIDNAIKFSPEYGTVKIEVQQNPNETVVSVSNEGEMPEETINHIFDKFYRGDTFQTEQGNGLGLSIAQKIMLLHGGILEAENNPAGYIVFRAVFPK
ncbi:MAG: HAMP domain-containing sensor histidine kinase [Oscillospiraceae bacterium]|jgi:signal transduction histidine kinase